MSGKMSAYIDFVYFIIIFITELTAVMYLISRVRLLMKICVGNGNMRMAVVTVTTVIRGTVIEINSNYRVRERNNLVLESIWK